MSQSLNCWYCGRDTMKEMPDQVHRHSRCTMCGATHCDLPQISSPAYTERGGNAPGKRVRTPTRGAIPQKRRK